jgi:hypothetical protein
MRFFYQGGFLLLLLMLGVVELEAQICSDCRVEFVDVVELTIPESAGGVAGHPLNARLDSSGRIWVLFQGDLPIFFRPDGRFGGRLGSTGSGPTEFRGATSVFEAGADSIAIIDPANSRVSVWSGELRLGRTIRMNSPIARAYALDWPSRVLIGASVLTPARAGWPLHLADLSGTSIELDDSFGAEQGEMMRGPIGALVLDRRFWADGTSWWIANTLEPVVRKWSLAGPPQLGEELRPVPPDWFGKPLDALRQGGALPNRVDGLWFQEDSELLWLFAREGDSDTFNSLMEELRSGSVAEASSAQIPVESEIYSTHAIVLNRSGNVVADVELPGLVVDVLSDGRVVFAVTGRLGVVHTSVRRVRLVEG